MTKIPIFNVAINDINLEKAFQVLNNKAINPPAYILFPDLSVLSEATEDPVLAEIINNAHIAMPDGKPSEFIAKAKGFKNVSTVSGFKLINRLLKESDNTHFFYGSTPAKLEKIKANLAALDPDGSKILGYKSPPFVSVNEIPTSEVIINELNEINKLKPDFVWIGLSSPKQDYLLYHHHQLFDNSYLLGVGGVFDYLSGEVQISPEWMKKLGVRWLYRLYKEPKRLYPKYRNIFIHLFKYYLR
ncbi:MAG: WecB/TagA/CpsF family glycosyltransferase [Balneolaceae bacterium]|nr:WecB/TagA/CpsF family glycosyltransferase [Balneolaceae bacterium]